MCDRTAPPGQATRPRPDLDLLADSVRAVAQDAVDLLGQIRALQAQVGALSRSTLNAAGAVEQARRHRDD
jgi:hypothetical protein